MNYSTLPVTALSLLALIALTACGGGGGKKDHGVSSLTSAASSPTPSSSSKSSSVSSASSSLISISSSSLAIAQTCLVHGKSWPICEQDNGSWSVENNRYCIAKSFCPANRTSLPTLPGRDKPVNAKATTCLLYTSPSPRD